MITKIVYGVFFCFIGSMILDLIFGKEEKNKKKKKATLCEVLGFIICVVSIVGLSFSLLYPFASCGIVIFLSMLSIGTMIVGCMIYGMEDK